MVSHDFLYAHARSGFMKRTLLFLDQASQPSFIDNFHLLPNSYGFEVCLRRISLSGETADMVTVSTSSKKTTKVTTTCSLDMNRRTRCIRMQCLSYYLWDVNPRFWLRSLFKQPAMFFQCGIKQVQLICNWACLCTLWQEVKAYKHELEACWPRDS